jgi:hypothetical protein
MFVLWGRGESLFSLSALQEITTSSDHLNKGHTGGFAILKICHFVSLALASWYLVTPPITYDRTQGFYIDYQMPPTQWTIIDKLQESPRLPESTGRSPKNGR